jgi:hypothetical protein
MQPTRSGQTTGMLSRTKAQQTKVGCARPAKRVQHPEGTLTKEPAGLLTAASTTASSDSRPRFFFFRSPRFRVFRVFRGQSLPPLAVRVFRLTDHLQPL